LQIFTDLSSTQTFAIYRRLLVRNRLRDNRNGCEESQRN
jgi:hypothetical protein